MKSLCRIYGVMLYGYPREFRAQFGREMQQVFRDGILAIAQRHSFPHLLRFLASTVEDWVATVFREWFGGIRVGTLGRHPTLIWKLAAAVCLLASTTVVRAYVIPSGSMEGSLRVGDHVLADRVHSKVGDIQRGDMITFLYPEDTRQTYVKRVIGLPGDRIRMTDKQVVRNGRRLVEAYTQNVSSSPDSYRDNFPARPTVTVMPLAVEMLRNNVKNGEVVVPPNSYFVLGDNRDVSWDSRYWGFVPRANIMGKPWIVFWSYDAPPSELVGWNRTYFGDLAQHFFTKTRWERTLLVLRSQAAQEVAP